MVDFPCTYINNCLGLHSEMEGKHHSVVQHSAMLIIYHDHIVDNMCSSVAMHLRE